MSNTAIWDALAKTDPKHTKQFTRAGGFKGTATKPIYHTKRMTDLFGPCGTGWGFSEPTYQLVNGADGEVAVYCWLTLWYIDPATGKEAKPIPGVGGDFVVKKIKDRLVTDDEAFKKATTDAEGNAMKALGMSADIHMGMFEDSKYLSGLQREFADEPAQQPARQQAPQPNPAYVVKGGDTVGQWVDRLAHLANGAPSDDVRREIAAANGAALQKLHDKHPDEYRRAMTVLGIQTQERTAA